MAFVKHFIVLLFFLVAVLLQGCASSNVERTAACSVDRAYVGSQSKSDVDIATTYQNTSQTTKGVIIGGVAGGLIGGLTNGLGAVAGTVTGAILGGALGAYIDANTTLVDKLENRGVKVFVLGDQVMIVMPSILVFNDTTPNIRYSAYSTLDLVSQLIGNYVNMSVHVAAYTNAINAGEIDLALTQQQAESVARYLWKRCQNTRLLYASGYGATHLVTCNSVNCAGNDNYRIEITFEKLPC